MGFYQEPCCETVVTETTPLGLILGSGIIGLIFLIGLLSLLAYCCKRKPEPRICPQVYVEPAYTEVIYDDIYEDVPEIRRPILATAPLAEEMYEEEEEFAPVEEYVEEPAEFVQPAYGTQPAYGGEYGGEYVGLEGRPVRSIRRRNSRKMPQSRKRGARGIVRRPIRRSIRRV